MQILKRIGIILVWLAGPVAIFAAANRNDPYLISLRGPGNIVLATASIIAVVVLIRRGYWRRGVAGRALILLWCLPSLSMLGAHASFEWCKRSVLQTDAVQARSFGRHFIVGYSSFPEVAVLAEKGLISGVYITRHNVAGSSPARLREEIAALQAKRRTAGLPALIVAADQEGGIVSHLAPPLTRLPALSTLASLAPDVRARRAEEFGRIHGQELAALGVNQNLAPVLDLRPDLKRNRFDFNTLIGQRAIQSRCQVQLADRDPIVAVQVLKQFHRRPDELREQIVWRDVDGKGLVDHLPARGTIAGDEGFEIGLGEILPFRLHDRVRLPRRARADIFGQGPVLLGAIQSRAAFANIDRVAGHGDTSTFLAIGRHGETPAVVGEFSRGIRDGRCRKTTDR